jgi:type II secretory pathway pseudopilin PulG
MTPTRPPIEGTRNDVAVLGRDGGRASEHRRESAVVGRRSSSNAGTALLVIILLVAVGIVYVISQIWWFLVENGLLWPAIILGVAGVAAFIWWANRNAKRRDQQAREREQNRIAAIEANREEWGDEICDHLIGTGQAVDDARVQGILSRLDEWGHETCLPLLKRSIGIGMTAEMVKASLGEPDTIDNRDVSASGEKYRWIYGVPRHGATYIWFKDDEVVRIRQ